MNIVYVGAFRLPNYDAAASRILNNAKAIRAAGHNIRFICWGGEYPIGTSNKQIWHTLEGFDYIITNEIDCNGGLIAKVLTRFQRGNRSLHILKSITSQIDAVISYNPSFKFNKMLLKYCTKHKLKYINDITEWSAYNELYITEWLYNSINMRCLTKKVRNKIVISNYLDSIYNQSYNVIVPPLCDINDSKWSHIIGEKELPRFDGITLIYAGNPAKKDCLHTAINAIQRALEDGDKLRFIIIGITKDTYLTNYGKLLRTRNLNDAIIFKGRISQDLVPAYYNRSDFMLLIRVPDRKSSAGFPTKFAESMISGTPVIANITSDLNEYLYDGINGFIVANDSEEALYKVIKNNVANISKTDLNRLAQTAKETGKKFDYHSRIYDFEVFLANTK